MKLGGREIILLQYDNFTVIFWDKNIFKLLAFIPEKWYFATLFTQDVFGDLWWWWEGRRQAVDHLGADLIWDLVLETVLLRTSNCISLAHPTVFLLHIQLYFFFLNPTVFILHIQLYLSRTSNCISLTHPIVFLSHIQLYCIHLLHSCYFASGVVLHIVDCCLFQTVLLRAYKVGLSHAC